MHGGKIGYMGPAILSRPLGVLESWDGSWYTRVATHGYLLIPGQQSDPAFFPTYPLLLRIGHSAGISLHSSGLLLSNLAFIPALLAFYELGTKLLPEVTARRATVYAAIFPLSFVFSMIYPTNLVLLALSLAGVLALHDRYGAAAIAAAVATLARPEALFICLPITAIAARAWPRLSPGARGRAITAILAAPLALLTYPLYLGWALHNASACPLCQHRVRRSCSWK